MVTVTCLSMTIPIRPRSALHRLWIMQHRLVCVVASTQPGRDAVEDELQALLEHLVRVRAAGRHGGDQRGDLVAVGVWSPVAAACCRACSCSTNPIV
jgi:hypothetical protein